MPSVLQPLASSALRLNKTTRRTSESTDKPEEEQQSNHVERALLNDHAKDPAAATKTPPHAVHNEAPPSTALDRRRLEHAEHAG